MRTETVILTYHRFDELDEQARQNALNRLWDCNVDYDWWQHDYEDAANIGLKISSFDCDRGKIDISYLAGHTGEDVARAILKEHGETCDTYKLAAAFLADREDLVKKYSDGGDKVTEENEYDFDCELDDLESEFLSDMGEEYLSSLSKEYDYLTGEEAIKETIEANEWEFDTGGNLA